MAESFLSQPVPVVFAVCQGIQTLDSGALNLLGMFDALTVYRMPDGTVPDVVTIQVVTVWTGGQGDFQFILKILDQDGNETVRVETPFTLLGPSHRHAIQNLVAIRAVEGIVTLVACRSEEEMLRQDFTIRIAPFPGTAT